MKRFVPAVLALAVLAGAGLYYWKFSPAAAQRAAAKAPPPPEVAVIKLAPAPVTIFDDFVAQTDAPDVIEIRAQVTGLLDRQAFADGSYVKKGDLLYVIDPRPFESVLAQAKANLAQSEANRIIAQQRLDRSKLLLEKNFVSKQDYDTALAVEQAAAAGVDAQKALVRSAELNLGFTMLRAPRDGVISKSLVKPGALITQQVTLLNTLYSSDPMYVYFAVSEARLAQLTQLLKDQADGAPAFRIRLLDGSEYRSPGRLNFVDAALDEKTGTLRARLAVPNPDKVLRPGQFVRVIVPTLERPDAIRLPQKAVMEMQGLKIVYVVGADGKAVQRQFEAQYHVGTDWIVDKGLAPGDVVVVEGTQKVRPGMPVKPVAAGAAAAEPLAGKKAG